MLRYRWRRALAAVTAMAAAAAMAAGLSWPVSAATTGSAAARAAGGIVSARPAVGTPQLHQTGNTTEVVRQLVQCKRTMYAVGSFTSIEQDGRIYNRSGVFSFSATAPFRVTSWNPGINGKVNSITFSARHCADAYIGGKFTSVHGTAVHNLAKLSTRTGAVVTSFRHDANGQVETLLGLRRHILVGGYFTAINGSAADPYMTGLNPATGANDNYLHLGISGNYQFPGATPNPTRVYNQQRSPNHVLDLVEGDFTRVGGQPRQQVFMLNLGNSSATVTGWTSAEFDQHCGVGHPFYMESGSWSPNDSTVYFADTGYAPLGGGRHAGGLCDAAVAFPAAQRPVSQTWINYTGCWSLYSTAADASAVYIGGHELYANNPDGCKTAGPGAVSASGLAGLFPGTGNILRNKHKTAGRYYRSRGEGADDMLLTSAGLWVASDNGVYAHDRFHLSSTCGNLHAHAGICFLPYG
jgi:hypothetical protein